MLLVSFSVIIKIFQNVEKNFFFASSGKSCEKMLLLLLFGILKENSPRYCKALVNENKHPESHSFGVFIARHGIKGIL